MPIHSTLITKNLILKPTVSVSGVKMLATISNWNFMSQIDSNKESDFEIAWQNDENVKIFFLHENITAGIMYMSLQATDIATVNKLSSYISSNLLLYTQDELLHLAANAKTPAEYLYALSRYWLSGIREYDKQKLDTFKKYFDNENAAIRMMVVRASGEIYPSVEFLHLLEKLSTLELDINIKNYMLKLIDGIRALQHSFLY